MRVTPNPRTPGPHRRTVAANAPCPVAVIRSAAPARRTSPVLVGLDGSANADRALAAAFDTAGERAVPLRVLRATQSPDLTGETALLTDSLTAWLVKYPDVAVEAAAVAGPPAAALIRAARRAQLLVVGTRGLGGFRGLRLGAVGQQVLHHAPGSVLIVRSAELPQHLDGHRSRHGQERTLRGYGTGIGGREGL